MALAVFIPVTGAAVIAFTLPDCVVTRGVSTAMCTLHHVVDLLVRPFFNTGFFRQPEQNPDDKSDAEQVDEYTYAEHGWLVYPNCRLRAFSDPGLLAGWCTDWGREPHV